MMNFQFQDKTITLLQGDITKVEADAIVNAANSQLRGGGGVDGAIRRAGGKEINAETRKIGSCPTGSAVVTTAGKLPAKHVIHAVGPIWQGGNKKEADLLGSAYHASLQRAEDLVLTSIAFPSISTGIYGFPIEKAAPIAIHAVLDHLEQESDLRRVIFVLFSQGDFRVYQETMEEIARKDNRLAPDA